MLLIPGAIFALIGLHLYLVVRLGVVLAAVVEGGRRREPRARAAAVARAGLVQPAPADGRRRGRPNELGRRAPRGFKRYKEDVKERGKPFYPFAMFHDTVMSLVVVCVIIGLAVVWKYTATSLGRAARADEADPGTITFVPRPDWYFYFLFYLLRIFKWPETVILGTIGIPTICLVLLLALPFVDVRPERRLLAPARSRWSPRCSRSSPWACSPTRARPRRRRLASELEAASRPGRRSRASQDNPKAVAGAKLFAESSAVPTATPTSASAAARTSARPTSRPRGRRARASSSRSTT